MRDDVWFQDIFIFTIRFFSIKFCLSINHGVLHFGIMDIAEQTITTINQSATSPLLLKFTGPSILWIPLDCMWNMMMKAMIM